MFENFEKAPDRPEKIMEEASPDQLLMEKARNEKVAKLKAMEIKFNETDSEEEEKNLLIKKQMAKGFQDMIPDIDKSAAELADALKEFEASGLNPFVNLPPIKEKTEY
jgi:hypothetical protein